MESLTETIAASRGLLRLADETLEEADALVAHYRARRVDAPVFDRVSLLTSASLRAEREASRLITYGDDNDLARADVVAEEISRLLLTQRHYRQKLDEEAGVSR